MTKQLISKQKLLESGLQYGHQTKSWNPAMKPFIQTQKRNIHLINLDKTSKSLENAYNIVKKIAEKRGTFLFVGTTKQSSKTVKENAERVGAYYIDHRWLGGILTNFKTIQNSINKLRRLERLEKNNFEGYTKKEGIQMKKQLQKLERILGGIKYMRKMPNAIFVTSIRNEEIAIKEAKKMKIPIFGIADTNVNPYTINFPIFGNDDANKATSLVTTIIADAIADARGEEKLAAYVEDEKIRILGLSPQREGFKREYPNRKFNRDFKKGFERNNNKFHDSKREKTNNNSNKFEKKQIKESTSDINEKTTGLSLLKNLNKKIEDFLVSNKIETIEAVSKIRLTKKFLSELPDIGENIDEKKEKMKLLVAEAKTFLK